MRRLRKAMFRVLSAASMIAAVLVAAPTEAQAAVPDRWGFAVVNPGPTPPIVTQQAGSWPASRTVTASVGGPGQVYVKFPQLSSFRGVVHVTAISQSPVSCQVERWGPDGPDLTVAVRCHIPNPLWGVDPVHSMFSIVVAESSGALPYTRIGGPAFGTVFWRPDVGVVSQYNSVSGAANYVTRLGPGQWQVAFSALGSTELTGNLQVTAVDPVRPARCKVGDWRATPNGQYVQVLCHDADGRPYDAGWTVTYHRERAVTGAVLPPKYFGYAFDHLPTHPGPYTPYPSGITFNSAGGRNTIERAGVAGIRWIFFPGVTITPFNAHATAFGTGPSFCNLLVPWDFEVRLRVACYENFGTTRNDYRRVDRPSLITQVSAY